jgi:hypothetical protein
VKQQAIHFVGLDMHQSTLAASVRDESGKVVIKATVPTEEGDRGSGAVPAKGARAFEEGDAGSVAARRSDRPGRTCGVCNLQEKEPLANRNDRIDADEMSERLRVGDLKPVFHGAPEILTLKELVRNYSTLVGTRRG